MKTTVSNKGQIAMPAELRKRDGIVPGQEFEVERLKAGQYLLRRIPTSDNAGMIDWVRSCPVQDWFQAIPSESTDSL